MLYFQWLTITGIENVTISPVSFLFFLDCCQTDKDTRTCESGCTAEVCWSGTGRGWHLSEQRARQRCEVVLWQEDPDLSWYFSRNLEAPPWLVCLGPEIGTMWGKILNRDHCDQSGCWSGNIKAFLVHTRILECWVVLYESHILRKNKRRIA